MAERFDRLVRPHVHDLYRQAFRYTGRREDAEDLVQDLLTKLYGRTAEMEQIDQIRPWLIRSLYHTFIDSLRKRGRTPGADGYEDVADCELSEPGDEFLRLEQRTSLARAMAGLSPEHRAVLVLHLVEGHSLAELRTLLDVQIGTLKSRLHRAKAQVRLALENEYSSEPGPEADGIEQRVAAHEV